MSVNSLQWYYHESLVPIGEELVLNGDEWHHCHHVMRLRADDHIILCDGKGNCAEGKIKESNKKSGIIEVIADWSDYFRNPRSYKLSIGIAPTKNIDRLEFAIEKLTEIGVDEIYFLICRNNERKRLRTERIENIALAAAKQSKKTVFPVIHFPQPLLQLIEERSPSISTLICHQDETGKSIQENYSPGTDVLLLIGPEGGFAPEEIEWMKKSGLKFIHLGPFRLRVETAAIAACTQIHFLNQTKT